MRISMVLQKFRFPNGHIYRGKDRIVKGVSEQALNTLRRDYEREEKNMFYLRHPYLTQEQSHGHTKDLKKHESKKELWNRVRQLKFKDHVKIEDRLNHLKVTEAWD